MIKYMNKFLDKLKTLILPTDYHADNDNYNKWLEICKIAGTTPYNETAIAITIALNMHEAFNNNKKAQETIMTALSFYHYNDDNTASNDDTTTVSTSTSTSTNANLNENHTNASDVSNSSPITTISNATNNANKNPSITTTSIRSNNLNKNLKVSQQINNNASTDNTASTTSNNTASAVNDNTVNTDKSGKTSNKHNKNSLNNSSKNKESKDPLLSLSIKKINNPKEFGDTVKTLSTIIEQNCSKLGYTNEAEKSIIKTKPYKKCAKIIGNINITSILALIKTGMPAGMKPSKNNTNDTISRRILSMTVKPITRHEFIQTILWFNGKCAYCGCEMKKSSNNDKCRTADHIIPMALDYNDGMGETAFGNVILVCRKCNLLKDNMTLDYWIKTNYQNNPELGNIIKHNIKSFMNYANYHPMSKSTSKFAYNEIKQLMELESNPKYTITNKLTSSIIANIVNRIKEYKNGKRGDKPTNSAIKNIRTSSKR